MTESRKSQFYQFQSQIAYFIRLMKILSKLQPFLFLSALMLPCAMAEDTAIDHFKITDQILQKNPVNFSTNLQFGAFAPWAPDIRVNAWNSLFTAGPLQFQFHGQATDGGDDWLQNNAPPRLSGWDSARSGFYDGADVYIYRIENGDMKLIRKTKVLKSVCGKDPTTLEPTEDKLWFTDKGIAPRNGDFYVLRMKLDKMPMQIRPELTDPKGSPMLGYGGLPAEKIEWSFDSANPAPEGGSKASLKLNVKEASESQPTGPWHWFVAHNHKESKVRFKDGKTYKAQIWLKQEGMSDPRVKIQFGTVMTATVNVPKEWKKFEFDLPVDKPEKPYAQSQGESTKMLIGAVSPGTLWVDNFLIYQTDVEPFAVMPEEIAILKDFKPHVLRLWGGLDAPSLDWWLNKGFAQSYRGGFGKTETPVFASLGTTLEVCQQTGADPWLIINPWFTTEENANLMEYLAGPADKGYGKLRAEHGHPEPWSKVFKKIYIESANEAWNQMMRYSLPSQPETYAAIADRQFHELKQSPYYAPTKFEFVANGWDNGMARDGWSRRVALASKEADRVDIAYYFGGWEKGATPVASEAEAVEEVYQDKLLTTALEFQPKIIDSATWDPNFIQRFAEAMIAEPDLFKAGLAAMPEGNLQFPADQLTGATPMELWAKDDKFDATLKRLIASRRSILEYPFWHAAYRAMAKSPALQPKEIEALAIAEPEILLELNDGLIDHNAPSRLVKLLKAHPETVKKWIASSIFPNKENGELEEFLKTGEKLTYGITNHLNKQLRIAIMELAKTANPEFIAAFRTEATPDIIKGKMKDYLNYVVGGTLNEPGQRRIDHLMKAMKNNPAFASVALEAIKKNPQFFHEEAAAIVKAISSNIAAIHSGKESYSPEDEAKLLLSALPPDVRKEMWQRLNEGMENSRAMLSPETQRLMGAMIAAQLGDTKPAELLTSDPLFITALELRITAAIPGPLLESAKNDARIGDKLTARLALTPGKNAKKLANYEGGPGYSLPGPGKPVPQEDENIGKSLALGTSTLDVSMEFLAAGSAPVAYYDFKTGDFWASHNNMQDRIPYPSWLALKMRNTLCKGDLMIVEPLDVKRIDVPDKKIVKTTNDGKGSVQTVKGRKGVPLTTCHAFLEDNKLSVLLINRSFTEPRTVSLEIPPQFGGPAKQFILTNADPKANNLKEANVKIEEKSTPDLKSGMEVTIPPASVIVLSGTK